MFQQSFVISKKKNHYLNTVKPVSRGHSKRRPENGFQDRLSVNAAQKYCRMLLLEHFAILLTCIKLPLVIKIFGLSTIEWQLKTCFTVCSFEWPLKTDFIVCSFEWPLKTILLYALLSGHLRQVVLYALLSGCLRQVLLYALLSGRLRQVLLYALLSGRLRQVLLYAVSVFKFLF